MDEETPHKRRRPVKSCWCERQAEKKDENREHIPKWIVEIKIGTLIVSSKLAKTYSKLINNTVSTDNLIIYFHDFVFCLIFGLI